MFSLNERYPSLETNKLAGKVRERVMVQAPSLRWRA